MPTWWGVPAAALVMGLVDLAKSIGFPSRYAGALAALLGVVGGVAAYYWGSSPLAGAAVNGLLAGLGAAGFYSTAKNVLYRP